jgi:hypothetical protein
LERDPDRVLALQASALPNAKNGRPIMQRREFLDLMTTAGFVGLASRNGWGSAAYSPQSPSSVPVIYSTDLFHPPDDPDDHVDLATLFALPELDVRAIILDLGRIRPANPGGVPQYACWWPCRSWRVR